MKLLINYKKKNEKHTNTWGINNVTKQRMNQQWDQGRNQKLPWDKWKWTYNNPKLWDTDKAVLRGIFTTMQAYLNSKKDVK